MEPVWKFDGPINELNEDLCGWGEPAKKLADKIWRLPSEDSFVVGINGKWGAGKSSFLNMTIKELEQINGIGLSKKDKKTLICRFEPWIFSGHEALVGIFLTEFYSFLCKSSENKADEVLKKTANLLLKYKKSIITSVSASNPILGTAISGSFLFLNWWHNSKKGKENTFQKKDQVRKVLKDCNRQIIIVMDDIDRLLANEIIQIFQLVKSVADFPNVVYILAYDLDVIAKTLKTAQHGEPYEYIEKIVQVAVNVPKITNTALDNLYGNELLTILGDDAYTKLRESTTWAEIWFHNIRPNLLTIRSVKRHCNSMRWYFTIFVNHIVNYELILYTWLISLRPDISDKLIGVFVLYEKLFEGTITEEETQAIKNRINSIFTESDPKIIDALHRLLPILIHDLGEIRSKLLETSKSISHPSNLKRLLEYNSDYATPFSPFQVEEMIKKCTTYENTKKVFLGIPLNNRRDWLILCEQLLSKNEYSFSLWPLAYFFFNDSDELEDDGVKSMFSYSFDEIVWLFARRCLKELSKANINNPYNLVKEVLNTNQQSLKLPLRFVFSEGNQLGIDGKQVDSFNETLLKKEQIEELQQILTIRIDKFKYNLPIDILSFSLHRLNNWGKKDKAKEIANYFINSNYHNLIIFIDSHKSTIRTSIKEDEIKFQSDAFNDYTDFNLLGKRIEHLMEDPAWNEVSNENKNMIEKCLNFIKTKEIIDIKKRPSLG